MKTISIIFIFVNYVSCCIAQSLTKKADARVVPSEKIRQQATETLNYICNNSTVKFKGSFKVVIAKRKTPLSTIPTLRSVFHKRLHRSYKIIISNKSTNFFDPILFQHLSDSAKVGVLSHEFAHMLQFQQFSTWQFLAQPFRLLFSTRIDVFERSTDILAISIGFGAYLNVWSNELRQKLSITHWRGVKANYAPYINRLAPERYLNPDSIETIMLERQNGSGKNDLSGTSKWYLH